MGSFIPAWGIHAINTRVFRSLLESYLVMYEATHDIEYLDKFVKYSYLAQQARDESFDCLPGSWPDHPAWSTYSVGSCSSCSDPGTPEPLLYQTGHILWPMAHFAYMIPYEYPALMSQSQSESDMYAFDNSQYIGTYGSYASWLEMRVRQTVAAFEPNWIDDWGYRQYAGSPCGGTDPETAQANMQLAMGAPMVYLRQIDYLSGSPSFPTTDDRVRTLAYKFRSDHLSECSVGPYPIYQWKLENWETDDYSCFPWEGSDDLERVEDISHATFELQFAMLCYKFQVPSDLGGQYGGAPYFGVDQMLRFINTFLYKVYVDPVQFQNSVNGTDNFYDDDYDDVNNYLISQAGLWLPLCEVLDEHLPADGKRRFYQAISDYHKGCLETEQHTLINSAYGQVGLLLGLAYGLKYAQLFKPLAVDRAPGGTHDDDWYGVTSGDFDADGEIEYVAVRNSDGGSYVFDVKANQATGIGYLIDPQTSTLNANQAIVQVDAGRIDLTPGDEFVYVRNYDGRICSFGINGSNQIYWKPYTYASANSDWTSLSVGNVDNAGGEDIIVSRNYDGRIVMFKYNGTSTLYWNAMSAAESGRQWIDVACGNINGTGADEILALPKGQNWLRQYRLSGSNLLVYATFPLPSNTYNSMNTLDVNGDGQDEIVLHDNANGAFEFYEYNPLVSSLTFLGREFFPVSEDNREFAGIRLDPDCPAEAMVSLRNSDGDMFIHRIALDLVYTACAIQEEKDQPIRTMTLPAPYPNPSTGLVTIPTIGQDPLALEVFDSMGRSVRFEVVSTDATGQQILIGSPGVYAVRVGVGASAYTARIVIQ